MIGMEQKVNLRPGERIDQLERRGYRIIQNPETFCFGMDAVLLSAFTRVFPGETAVDLGTGTGVIPILMEARYQAGSYTALEIQPDMAEMASRSVQLNGLENKISVLCQDLCQASAILGKARFDIVTSNPPYMKTGQGMASPEPSRALARHEIACKLEDVVREASALLKTGGRFYLVHRPGRLAEVFEMLHRYHLEPKRLRMVHPYVGEEANLVLLESVRGGNGWMKAEAPLVIYESQGVYTEEIWKIYRE